MHKITDVDNTKSIWGKLSGSSDEFSIENRAFNYVCVISFILLIVFLFLDAYICLSLMTGVLIGLMVILGIMYYYSRFKKKYKFSIYLYIFFSYVALTFNFFVNAGTYGPTLFMFFVTFIFLLTLGKPKHYVLWNIVHILVVCALIAIEYYYPKLAPDNYPDRHSRYLDLAVTSTIAIIFIYTIINYLRHYFEGKMKLSDQRALAISEQNTQILAQNKMLEQVNDEKNRLFSIVSHDLKSPLDSIKGFLELLSSDVLDHDEKIKIEEDLLEQTKYTSDLLMNLMSWAKAQMQGVTVNLLPHNLKDIVEQVAANKLSIAARKGIKLTYSIYPTIEVVCDVDMLHIVLRNLINNALKFTPSGGEVYLKATKKDNKAVISVQDTGIGIAPEKQEQIFTLKTRSTYGTNKEKGIGLGLLMCKEFTEYQNGEIWFESEQGKGTTFYISLPLTKL